MFTNINHFVVILITDTVFLRHKRTPLKERRPDDIVEVET
jgi:hypothetical protein